MGYAKASCDLPERSRDIQARSEASQLLEEMTDLLKASRHGLSRVVFEVMISTYRKSQAVLVKWSEESIHLRQIVLPLTTWNSFLVMPRA